MTAQKTLATKEISHDLVSFMHSRSTQTSVVWRLLMHANREPQLFLKLKPEEADGVAILIQHQGATASLQRILPAVTHIYLLKVESTLVRPTRIRKYVLVNIPASLLCTPPLNVLRRPCSSQGRDEPLGIPGLSIPPQAQGRCIAHGIVLLPEPLSFSPPKFDSTFDCLYRRLYSTYDYPFYTFHILAPTLPTRPR